MNKISNTNWKALLLFLALAVLMSACGAPPADAPTVNFGDDAAATEPPANEDPDTDAPFNPGEGETGPEYLVSPSGNTWEESQFLTINIYGVPASGENYAKYCDEVLRSLPAEQSDLPELLEAFDLNDAKRLGVLEVTMCQYARSEAAAIAIVTASPTEPPVAEGTVTVEEALAAGGLPNVVLDFLGKPAFPQNTIADVPGGTTDEPLMDAPPAEWIIPDGTPDKWGVPYVTKGELPMNAEGVDYKEHHAFDLAPGATYSTTWLYSSFSYFNGDLNKDITHNTWGQQTFIWGAAQSGKTQYDGLAIWGPNVGATVTVTYHINGDTQTCTGTSAEFVPGIETDLVFHNEGTTAAYFGIGPWGAGTLQGSIPPACRPEIK